MTLGQFAVVVGAPPKWVQNTFRLLALPNEYTVSLARTLRLVRVIWETCGTEITDAYRLANEALERSVEGLEWNIESPDGSISVVFDRDRFLSSFACALARARVLYSEKRRGRPLRHQKHGISAAPECGVDVGLLEAMLLLTPQDRLRRLDRDLAVHSSSSGQKATRLLPMLEELNRKKIRYVLVGDVAAGLLGAVSEPTRVEICYDRRDDNLRALARWLASVHAYPRGVPERLPFVMDAQTLLTTLQLPLTTKFGAIDILAMVKGVGAFDPAHHRAIRYEIDGVPFAALGLAALLDAARFSERAVDRKHIVELEVLEELATRGGSAVDSSQEMMFA